MLFKPTRLKFPAAVCGALFCLSAIASAGDAEFSGTFNTELVADNDSTQRIAFRFISPERLKGNTTFAADAHVSSAQLYDPALGETHTRSVLVEEKGKLPVIFIDLNRDNSFSDEEKFTFKKNPTYRDLYELNVKIPILAKDSKFAFFPAYIRFMKGYKIAGMTADDRLIEQSDEAYAQGTVDIRGKKVLVQYIYDFANKQVDPALNKLGIDSNGDGQIDMDDLSPESALARGETPVFRIDTMYVSTKKADLQKNVIVLREQSAKDYKRIELQIGATLPDFEFTDYNGKKRKFSEFRGKYVLLDVWGLWCPACMDELPFIKTSYEQFKGRNFEIIGLNTDEKEISFLKKSFEAYGVKWTQATYESVVSLLREKMMIRSFPTTMLISPEGKILSLARVEKGDPDLRGEDLLETLDGILPQGP